MLNKNFYPTPEPLIAKMLFKCKFRGGRVLEPSAGKGDIIEKLEKRFSHYDTDIFAIESDPALQATLRGKDIKLIDSDFLSFSGPDKFDLIIANPPFDEGDKHLLKAIDIMYRGEIVFLLNAETLKNPCTNTRKLLVRRLEELDASIDFIPDAFLDAERKTKVEVALVYINIDRKIEDDLFSGVDAACHDDPVEVNEKHEVSAGKSVQEMVAEYNEVVRVGTELILDYFKNVYKIGGYLSIVCPGEEKMCREGKDLTEKVQKRIALLLKNARASFWRKTLNLNEVRKRMTRKKRSEFEHQLAGHSFMDFTESNVRQFVINLIGGYEQTLSDAVVEIFDLFTVKHCYRGDVLDKNIHYFNGWKTNNAYKVGRRVIIPGESYSSSFTDDYTGKWHLDWHTREMLDDIDTVMNYFDGMSDYTRMSQVLEREFSDRPHDRMSGLESTYFTMTCYKKGTIHLTFQDQDILRRFNVVACRGKGWLPEDYGSRPFRDLSPAEKETAATFEGQASYDQNRCNPLFQVVGSAFGLEYKKAV